MTTLIKKPTFVGTKWNYRLTIQGIGISYWETCSAIKSKVTQDPMHGGGEMDPILFVPGKRTHEPVTLTVGVSESDELQKWWDQVGDIEGKGAEIASLERKVTIELLKRDKTSVLRTHELIGAVPEEYTPLDGLDAKEGGGYALESIMLKYRQSRRI